VDDNAEPVELPMELLSLMRISEEDDLETERELSLLSAPSSTSDLPDYGSDSEDRCKTPTPDVEVMMSQLSKAEETGGTDELSLEHHPRKRSK